MSSELTDEYELEVGRILSGIKKATSPIELRKTIYQEFVRCFDGDTVGSEENFSDIALEIWDVWVSLNK